jgi:putative membrane protein
MAALPAHAADQSRRGRAVHESASASERNVRPHRVGSAPDPRFSFANERTFLAWNRTALALIGGGLAAAQLLRFGLSEARLLIGLPLIALGAVLAIAGVRRWRMSELAMRLRAPIPRARLAPGLLGVGTAAIALLSLIVLTLDQLR